MQIGDKVWIFDENNRIYKDENGNKTTSPWYRGHFVERFIIGETKQSWIVGYKGSNIENRSNLKVKKKTLEYKKFNGIEDILYISEDDVNKKCWVHNNRYKLSNDVIRCDDYNKLIEIKKILDN